MPPKPGRSGSSTSPGRSGPLLLLAIALLAGCEGRDLDAELAAAKADVASISTRVEQLLVEKALAERALVAAMHRANVAEVELEETQALCPVRVPL